MRNMRNIAVWVIVALMLFTTYNVFRPPTERAAQREITFSQFVAEVDAGNVGEVVIEGDSITGRYADGATFETYVPNDPNLIDRLQKRGVNITAKRDTSGSPGLIGILLSWFPMLLLIGVWVFFMRQMQNVAGRAMGFGKSKARMLNEA